MKLIDIVTVVQFLLGAPIILFAIFMGLQIRKDASKSAGEMACRNFFHGLFLNLLSPVCIHTFFQVVFSFEMLSGSVFLAGACFMYIIIK